MTITRTLAAVCCLLVAALPAQDKSTGPAHARDAAKEAIEKLKATGPIFVHPVPATPLNVTWSWPLTPVLDDAAFQTAFQRLRAAQQELARADTPAKARKALDRIEKALMQTRRALWKAEKEGRKLHPRPTPIVTGVRVVL